MRTFSRAFCILIGLALSLLACSGNDKAEKAENNSAYFPQVAESTEIKKVSEPVTYAGQALFEYINGGAEIYHTYKFIVVAAADYKLGESDIILDIYQFENADYAFGLYAALRPPRPEYISLGVEGYVSSSRIEFLKGQYLVRLTAYESSPELRGAMTAFANEVEKNIPGRNSLPEIFAQLPWGEVIDGSSNFIAESYLGQTFLTEIYTRDYLLDGDTVTLFLTNDPDAFKFENWKSALDAAESPAARPIDDMFDAGQAIFVPDSYYGQIIAGLKGSKLVGMVNYHPEQQDDLAGWLDSMK